MKELTGLHRGDAAIVGGGLTGLLLASSLAQAGMRVIVLETGESRVQPCTGLGTILCTSAYHRIQAVHGLDTARPYADALMGHLSVMLTEPPPYVEGVTACLYARTSDELPSLSAQAALLQQLGMPSAISADTGDCPFPAEAVLKAAGQALVDMAAWSSALAQNIQRCGGQLLTCSAVTSLHSRKLCTARGCAEAPVIVFAGGMPPLTPKHPAAHLLERRLLVYRELQGAFALHSCLIPVDGDGLALYPASSGALACWDASRCGTRREQQRLCALDAALTARLPDWLPGAVRYQYETFSLDGLPVIGNLPGTRHLFAAGTGQAGLLGALHAAAVLSRRILGHMLPEDQLYAPDRPLPRWFMKAQQRQQQNFRLRSLLRRNRPPCSHCGCHLRYCSPLSIWECPGCGSVFDLLGQVLCGPAMQETPLSARQRPDW